MPAALHLSETNCITIVTLERRFINLFVTEAGRTSGEAMSSDLLLCDQNHCRPAPQIGHVPVWLRLVWGIWLR
jgi:hypothetical protein